MAAVQQIAPGIFLVSASTPEYDVRAAVVLGSTHALVWDTLTHPRDMADVAPLVGDRRLVVAYSHGDWDHVWGTAGLRFDAAEVVGHRVCSERFAGDVPVTLSEKRAAEPGAWDDVVLVPPSRTFEEALDVDLGGVEVAVRHLPGHTPDCCVAFVPCDGVLLAGDTVETPFPVVPPGAPVREWVERLRRWQSDDRVKLVVPAHGTVGGCAILQQNIEYLQALLHGRPIEPPGELTPFYRETHRANAAWRP